MLLLCIIRTDRNWPSIVVSGIDNIDVIGGLMAGYAGFVLFLFSFSKIPRNDEYDSERQLHTK